MTAYKNFKNRLPEDLEMVYITTELQEVRCESVNCIYLCGTIQCQALINMVMFPKH
jgi:hypothetical protein